VFGSRRKGGEPGEKAISSGASPETVAAAPPLWKLPLSRMTMSSARRSGRGCDRRSKRVRTAFPFPLVSRLVQSGRSTPIRTAATSGRTASR